MHASANHSLHAFGARKVTKLDKKARTAVVPKYGDKLKYTCMEGYHVKMRDERALVDDPTSFEYECMSSGDIETISPSGMVSAECVPVTCPIKPVGPEASLFHSKRMSGPDWTTVECDAGQWLVGGGCDAAGSPWTYEYSGPDGPTKWKCGGHGTPKHVWIMCSAVIKPEIVQVSGGDWTTVTCPAGKTIISGGCQAAGHPWIKQYDGPMDGHNDKWQCGGQGGPKKVWAICSAQLDATIVRNHGGDWVTSTCPGGMKIIGGGCDAHTGPHKYQRSSPDGENKWICGGHGGGKTVWAMCAAINEAAKQFPAIHSHDSMKRSYGDEVPMLCGEGYSVDGHPYGAIDFTEKCTDSGEFSTETECKDIDWCKISKCGKNGKCLDSITSYSCDCDAGFESSVEDGHLETCVQIDECATMSGTLLCGGQSSAMGACTDETSNYTCACAEGHENLFLDDGRDTCTPVTCEALATRPHSSTAQAGRKLSYTMTAHYVCDQGYTLDGTAGGGAEY
jgi:hypothetical protein